MNEWLASLPFIVIALLAAWKTPVSDKRKYSAWRQGPRDAMHNFAYGFAPVPRDRRGEAP